MTLASSIAIVCKALLAAALLTITCPLGASAAPNSINLQWTHGNSGSGGACPQAVDGGCAASPGGNFTQANFATHAQQSGQGAWAGGAHPWNWNSPCIDYACGYYTATGSLLDPAVSAPTGCTYNATGNSIGGPELNCTGVVNITGYNLALHSCVPVKIDSGATSVTIKDDNFASGSNCLNNTDGPGSIPYLVDIVNQATTNVDVESNNIDGGGATATYPQLFIMGFSGSFTAKYNKVINSWSNPFQMTHLNTVLFQYNYVDSFCLTVPAGHCETFLTGAPSGTASITFSYNVVLLGSSSAANETTALGYISPAQTGSTITLGDCDHNVLIANQSGGPGGSNVTSAMCEISYATYTNVTIQNNYVDLIGALSTTGWIATSNPVCTNPTSFSGNINLETGAAVNSYSSNNGTGC